MAESRNYTITLKIDGSAGEGGTSTAVAGASTPSSSATASSASVGGGGGGKSGVLSKEGAKAFMKAMTAYHTVKSFAVQQINYTTSIVELRTGSREMQQRAQFQNQIAQKGVGILEMGVAGALIGGLPGAVLGLTLSTAHTVIGYTQKQNTLELQETLENRSLEMLRIRAGSYGSRSNNQ